jgi:lysyl endopeptidase
MQSKSIIKKLFGSMALARLLFAAAVVVVLPVSGFAKMYEEPKSFSLRDASQERVDRKVLPTVDTERLLAEDRARGKNPQPPGPLRFAIAADVAFDLNNSGTWQDLPDGRLWRLRIQSPGAKSLNLGITRFDMPEGAKLWIYDPQNKHVEGPYTSRNRSRLGSLWTPLIEGDEIVVELFVPSGASQPVISIAKVNRGYRGFEKTGVLGGSEGTCEIDVVCPQGAPWSNQIRSVAVYTINGTSACTGTLLNNVALDGRPFILSANHCGVNTTTDGTIVVFWNFQAAVCGTHGPGSLTDTQTGADFRSSNAASDFVLFELAATPDPSFNVFYAGWDASGTAPPSTVGIHHPSADVKAISFSNSAAVATNPAANLLTDTPSATGNHWRADWSSGVTEHGSSGSCLFATNTQRCIGQLHGGPSVCGAAAADLHDYYGRFSTSWTGGGTSTTRLSNWLDPGNTGTIALDGDPHITTANGIHYDFQGAGEFVSLRDANGLEIQTRQTPIATTFNPGANPHTGLATCVSLNTAVAARVGKYRVTYQPNLSGVPDPSGLQLRVDGALTTLAATGHNLGNGGRIAKTPTPGGIEIDFPDGSVLFVTPGWWASQSKWYLNVSVVRSATMDGMGGSRDAAGTGIAGAIAPGDWLPLLPDGSSMGHRPGALHERYVDLYQKFADAWRVTDKITLFDYAPNTSTSTFTLASWPPENPPCVLPEVKPVKPASLEVAQRACRAVVGINQNADCVFDVRVTGNTGFAATYLASEKIQAGWTSIVVTDDKDPSRPGEPVTFIATVAQSATMARQEGSGVPTGTVQFTIDGERAGEPAKLDAKGQARWSTARLKDGKHKIAAQYIPAKGSALLASSSPDESHLVGKPNQ